MTAKKIAMALLLLLGATSASLAQGYGSYDGRAGFGGAGYGAQYNANQQDPGIESQR